jgi:hypothetical protein
VLGFQTFLYFQIFPSDALRYKLLVWIIRFFLTDNQELMSVCQVAWIWCAHWQYWDQVPTKRADRITDAAHSGLICTAIWQYVIVNFSNPDVVQTIFPFVPSIPYSRMLTG